MTPMERIESKDGQIIFDKPEKAPENPGITFEFEDIEGVIRYSEVTDDCEELELWYQDPAVLKGKWLPYEDYLGQLKTSEL